MLVTKWFQIAALTTLVCACSGGSGGTNNGNGGVTASSDNNGGIQSFSPTLQITQSNESGIAHSALSFRAIALSFASQVEYFVSVIQNNPESTLTLNCISSGTASFKWTGTGSTVSAGNQIDVTISNCGDGASTTNARITTAISDYTSNTNQYNLAANVKIASYTVSQGTTVTSYTGSETVAVSHSNSGDSYSISNSTLSVISGDYNGSAKNLFTKVVNDYTTGTYSDSLSADITDTELGGSYSVKTETSLGGSFFGWPTSGSIVFTGGSGSALKMSADNVQDGTRNSSRPVFQIYGDGGAAISGSPSYAAWPDYLVDAEVEPINSSITPPSASPVLFVSNTQSINLTGDTSIGGTLPNAAIQFVVGYPGTQHLYVYATHSGTALQGVSATDLNQQSPVMSAGTVTINTYSAAIMGAGVYMDNLSISVCKDAACTEQIAGSPYVIPVTYTVTGNVTPIATASVTNTNLLIEADGYAESGPTATVIIMGANWPPYGLNIIGTPTGSGVVTGTTTQLTSDGAQLQIDLESPSLLPSGTYNDTIQLNVCFDVACSRPLTGSPWVIHITYVVPAIQGRDFQTVTVSNIGVQALAWDSARNKILAALTSDSITDPSSLTEIDPSTGTLGRTLALPSAPDNLTVSDDGQYAIISYMASSVPTLARVRLSDFSVESTLPLNVYAVEELQFAPESAHTVLVGTAGPLTVSVYDDLTPRPGSFSLAGLNWAQWDSSGTNLFIADSVSGTMYDFALTATGLGTPTHTTTLSPLQNPGWLMPYGNGFLYLDSGFVFDTHSNTIIGALVPGTPLSGASTAYEKRISLNAAGSKAFMLYTDMTNFSTEPATLQAFDAKTFTSLGYLRLPTVVASYPTVMNSWGTNGLVIGDHSHAVILSGAFMGP